MKIRKITLVAFAAMCMMACQPEPEACFDASAFTVTPGTAVSFTNCSADGDSYEWDFGDGNTSTEVNPTHVYRATGTFLVSLTSNSKNGKKSDKFTVVINVGQRYLDDIVVSQFPFQTPTGLDWDENGSPDLQFFFGRSTNELFDWSTPRFDDVQPSELPIGWLVVDDGIILTDESWDWVLFEMDSDTAGTFMSGWQFNPLEDDNNPILLVGDGNNTYEIELFWSIR